LLDECSKLEKEALRIYKSLDDRRGLGSTYNELNTCLVDRLNLEWDKQTRQDMLREALSYGDKAIAILSELGEEHELARAYYTTSMHYNTAAKSLELEKQRELGRKALTYSKKAVELSEKTTDRYLIGASNAWLGTAITDFSDHPESAAKHFEKALHCGRHTRDNHLIGRASYLLAHMIAWEMVTEEDPEKIRAKFKKCEKYSKDAIDHFSLVSNDQEVASSHYWYAEGQTLLATSAETRSQKRILLKKSVEVGRKGLKHARRSGSVKAIWLILHPLSKALFLLSAMEPDADLKKRLLDEALRYREENIKTLGQAMPYHFWNHGVYHNWLALIHAALAELEKDNEQKLKLLEDAKKSSERCINSCLKERTLSQGQYAVLGGYYRYLGGILNQLYQLTKTPALLSSLLEVFKGAVETFQKAELPSRTAESYWQLARTCNKLQNYMESAENFKAASIAYKAAAKKLPSLSDFYSDYATYMQAWSEIEKARAIHAKGAYGQARKHYKKAADLHESTKSWNYLSPNYLAWAQLERGEHLSRREQSRKAKGAFEKAADLFSKAKSSLETELDKIEGVDERNMAMELVEASDSRLEYCLGRIAVEEAKILDRLGDHASSAERYGLAAETFEKMAQTLEDESDQRELKPIIYLCRAWQKMALAEATVSPDLYLEAAELFEKAKGCSFGEKARRLALGHSYFCRALEAGAKFEATRDTALYLTTTQHLESAASYYVKAGFRRDSVYAKATQRLFDAYLYVDDAKKARDVQEKAKYYSMAEKVLETSIGLYRSAKHREKGDMVQRLLDEVREDMQLVMSLDEVFHAPPAVAATATFSTPLADEETAVGLEKFEHAHIQATLTTSVVEVDVGDDLGLEIELINTGNGPASLIRVEELIPEGFELLEKPARCRVEACSLDMKGKSLVPLKTDSVKLVLRPKTKGTFHLKPKVLYLDETGKHKVHEPESVTVTVKELGIKGWIKG
jgi:hypothetical protein